MDHPDTKLVSVFKTGDPGILPLATMALDAEGIAYAVRQAGKYDSLQWQMSQTPTNRPMSVEIVVASDEAARARDLLVDLERPMFDGQPPDPAMIGDAAEPATVRLEEAVSGALIGGISESQLQELTSHLEEDAPQRYFVNRATVEMLKEAGVDPALVALLEHAAGAGDGLVIRWLVR